MTRTAPRTRAEVLRDVVAATAARRDGRLPLDVAGVREAFQDELDLLGALQLRWHARLSGRIERELAEQPVDLARAVVSAWQAAADELPGVRAVLDRHRTEPLDADMAAAMRTATDKEHALLAVSAGLAGLGDPGAARLGAAIEEQARARRRPRPSGARTHAAPTVWSRLKAALAA